jgi:hypothetical protein
MAELFEDAGCCFDDPVLIDIFAPDDSFIERIDTGIVNNLIGYLGEIDTGFGIFDAWPYGTFEYSSNLVGKVIIGGNSEPTSLDRLSFTFANVPEPQGLALMCLGLIAIAIGQRKRLH